jgi:hypothetical protein
MESQNDDQEFKALLEELKSNPEVFSRVEPPVGYEAQLLSKLDKSLNKKSLWFGVTKSVRQWGWAAGVAGVAFFIFSLAMNSDVDPQLQMTQADPLLVQIANEGGEGLVDRWAAMQGDTFAQRSMASDFLTVVAQVDAAENAKSIVDQIKLESL